MRLSGLMMAAAAVATTPAYGATRPQQSVPTMSGSVIQGKVQTRTASLKKHDDSFLGLSLLPLVFIGVTVTVVVTAVIVNQSNG